MSEPSNADIFQFMGRLDAKIDGHTERLVSIEAQTKKTNGRVNRLEERNRLADALIAYDKEHKPALVDAKDVPLRTNDPNFTKILLAIIGFCTVAVGAIAAIANAKL